MAFDLHVHTTYSLHAYKTPREAVKIAVEKGLDGIAITDHDTVEGIEEAVDEAKNHKNFKVIPGGEFSFNYKNIEGEILAYFIDPESIKIRKPIEVNLKSTQERDEEIAERLGHSYNFGLEELKDYVKENEARKKICRNDIIYFMMDKELIEIKNFKKAFKKYVGRDAPNYISRRRKSIRKVITCIKKAGGVPIFAHIGVINKDVKKIENIAKLAIEEGIDGFEIYDYTNKGLKKEEMRNVNAFCYDINKNPGILVPQAKGKLVDHVKGSDCHFREGGVELGSWVCEKDVIDRLEGKSRLNRRKHKH